MSFKPNDFSLGIIDFLGILLPGAILMFLHGNFLIQIFGTQITIDGQLGLWVAFFVWSYIIGHFLLGVGVPLNRLLKFTLAKKNHRFYDEVASEIKLPPGTPANREDCFYRAYSFVRLYSAAAIVEVDRQAAEYKLFRSLTLVFLLDTPLAWIKGALNGPRAALTIVFAGLALARFLFLLAWTQRLAFEFYHLLKTEGPVKPAV